MGNEGNLNNSNPEYRREPHHSRPSLFSRERVGKERYYNLIGMIIIDLYLNPSLSFSRLCWGNHLREMWRRLKFQEERESTPYTINDILVTIDRLEMWLTGYGLILDSEAETMRHLGHVNLDNRAPKYKTYDELLALSDQWKSEGKLVGLVHGAFDPPHIAHSTTFYYVWPYCDILLGGFDSNSLVKARKGPDRPRFPQLAWRMWEIASLPTIDYVFVSPIQPGKEDKQWPELYERLNIKAIGTEQHNPLLPKFLRSMYKLDGKVITDEENWWSSTAMMRDREIHAEKNLDNVLISDTLSKDHFIEEVNRIEQQALAAGYLRDYPHGT